MATAMERPKPQRAVTGKIPFRLRFKAWWDGNELYLKRRQRSGSGDQDRLKRQPGYRDPERPWETPRVRLLQGVWGEGFCTPGGRDYIRELVKPFGLNPAMSMLHLGAGLGGPARLFVEEFGAWVSGLEHDHELAGAGAAMSTLAGMAKKAVITPIDLQNLELSENSFDAILVSEVLFAVADKQRLLRYIQQALKIRGQFLITDFVFTRRGGETSPAIRSWIEQEPLPPSPWTADEYVRFLHELKLDVRVTEDMTASFRNLIIQSWSAYTATVSAASLDAEMARCLVAEADFWTRRVAAIDSGELQVCRIYGLKKPVDKMLSDW